MPLPNELKQEFRLEGRARETVWFKNNTDGELMVAINAIRSAPANHRFIRITGKGKVAVFRPEENPHCHIRSRKGANRFLMTTQIFVRMFRTRMPAWVEKRPKLRYVN